MKCWTAGIGGGPVQLIQFARGCDEVAAWEWAGHYTGVEPEAKTWTKGERKAWIDLGRLDSDRRHPRREVSDIVRAMLIRFARSCSSARCCCSKRAMCSRFWRS
jgi:hypothetical protein